MTDLLCESCWCDSLNLLSENYYSFRITFLIENMKAEIYRKKYRRKYSWTHYIFFLIRSQIRLFWWYLFQCIIKWHRRKYLVKIIFFITITFITTMFRLFFKHNSKYLILCVKKILLSIITKVNINYRDQLLCLV